MRLKYRRLLDPAMSAGMPSQLIAQLELLSGQQDGASPVHSLARNALLRHRDWIPLNEQRAQLREVCARFREDYDVLLCPVAMLPAFPHDHTHVQPLRTLVVDGQTRPYQDMFVWCSLATCTYLPASVVPVGLTPGGLPAGMQIIGPYLEDSTTLDFAGRVSDVLGGFVAPPGY